MAITISDVAKEAGVSTSTVSKVLNGWTTISPATVERVNVAIKKLNYIPNARAVSFARQSTHNIVYLTNLGKKVAFENPHMFDIMCGVHRELTAHHYTLTLVDTSEEDFSGQKALQEISRQSTDGLIIHGSAINEELSFQLVSQNVPHIIIGHPDFGERLCWIDTNHALAGEYAAEHLSDCGYKNILFIGGKKSDVISNQRLKGFLKGMLNRNVHIPKEQVGYTASTRESAYDTTIDLLKKHPHTEAVVCENSLLALGVTKALRHLNLRVPDDIALLTFDSYPFSRIIDPELTVVDVDVYDMGKQAGEMMIKKLKHPDLLIQSYTTLPVVIQGKSTRIL